MESKKHVHITVPMSVADTARRFNLNVSRVCTEALKREIRESTKYAQILKLTLMLF